jgi:carbon monoxide dehydrogenase subunit G
MELNNEFVVNRPVEEAWAVLTDVETIAPCLPGAQLQEVEGDQYRGIVKVKVGPITAQFKGQATFLEKDDVNHRAVLKAEGRDTTGKGNAAAIITAQLHPQNASSTHVSVTTDLTITGKVAQFGRGALADVSTKLLGQFVENLETTVLTDHKHDAEVHAATAAGTAGQPEAPAAPGEAGGEPSAGTPSIRRIEAPEAAPVDLLDAAGAPVIKRLAPLAIVVLIVLLLLRRRKRSAD